MSGSSGRHRKRSGVGSSRVKEWTKNVILIDFQGEEYTQPLPLYDYQKLFDGLIRLLSDMSERDVRDEIVRLVRLKQCLTHKLDNISPASFEFVKVYNRRVRPLDGDVPFDAAGIAHIYKNGNVYVRLVDTSLWKGEKVSFDGVGYNAQS